MVRDKKVWQCLGRIVVGCVFLVHRLGFNCEVDSDEINFIVWRGIGKKLRRN